MLSGTPRSKHRSWFSFSLLVLFLFAASAVWARQASGSPQSSSNTSTNSAQSAVPIAAGAQSQKPADAAKDIVPDSALVKLGAGDLIEVNVYNVPELATKARVSNAGDIYLPLVDYVHVDGLTQEEAQALIEKRLADGGFVRNPHVTIFVDEASSQGITILGEVNKPGICLLYTSDAADE